jgi:hypothetical protein
MKKLSVKQLSVIQTFSETFCKRASSLSVTLAICYLITSTPIFLSTGRCIDSCCHHHFSDIPARCWPNGRSPNFGVFFAIPIESNHSGFCWLNFLCAELREDDAVWLVGAIVWVTSHCIMTLWAYIDCSRVSWDLYGVSNLSHFCWWQGHYVGPSMTPN